MDKRDIHLGDARNEKLRKTHCPPKLRKWLAYQIIRLSRHNISDSRMLYPKIGV
jgi:hypothetical protein